MTRSPSPSTLRRETMARLGAVVLALLFVLAQGASLADRVMVEHALCPEHGEWIHVRAGGSSLHPVSLERQPGHSRHALLRAAQTAPEPDEHDVCTLSVLDEPCDGVPLRQGLTLGLPGERGLPHDRHLRAASSLPLLGLAPKGSPPPSV